MSPSIPRDGERFSELALDAGKQIAKLVREVVPPDAATHLLNAQRELLTALVLIYEHQAGARRPAGRISSRSRRAAPRRRLNRIKVD